MKIETHGANKTEVNLNDGTLIFFSYQTPVAGRDKQGFFRTDKKWSVTTSKHINQWLDIYHADARIVGQNWIDSLLDK